MSKINSINAKIGMAYIEKWAKYTPIAERLTVQLSLPVLNTYVCRRRGLDSNTNLSSCRAHRGNLPEPVTFRPIAESLTVELSPPVLTT